MGQTDPMPDDDLWERHAAWWQDQFTDGVDPEYTEQILPLAVEALAGCDRVLEVGTGEGQVARTLRAAGVGEVFGIDPTEAQIAEAGRRAGGVAYARAGAAALPFPDEAFDGVVACLVFEHVDDVDAGIAEIARVLRVGGRFAFFLNHPLLQTPGSGWIDDQILDPPEQYWRVGAYLDESVMVEEVAKDVFLPYVHRPLSRYVNAMAADGLFVRKMLEPAPPPGFLAIAEEFVAAATIPRLLFLLATKEG